MTALTTNFGHSFYPSTFLELNSRIVTSGDLTAARTRLNMDLYGAGGSIPSEVGTLGSVASPVTGLTGLDRCEAITMTSYTARPRVWWPSPSGNGKLMILHQGHSWSYNDGFYGLVLQVLLTAGFTVCGLVLPGGVDVVTGGSSVTHDSVKAALSTTTGPVTIAVNTLIASHALIYMSGISGGGWSTTVAAASEQRIARSYPIAGSLPRYMTIAGSGFRDWEQHLPGITQGYLDLYLLGACGSGRRQKQILHIDDPVVFSLADYQSGEAYAGFIAARAASLGGDYDLVFRAKDQHLWDTTIFSEEVLAELP